MYDSTVDTPPMSAVAAFHRFVVLLKGEGGCFAAAGTLLVGAAVTEIIAVFVLSDVIDSALSGGSSALLRSAAVWMALTLAGAIADYWGQILSIGMSERVVLRLRSQLFAHVQKLSPRTHRTFGLGDLVARHTSDLEAVEHLTGSGLMQLVVSGLSAIGLAVAAFVMSWQVALTAVVAVPLMWGISALFGRAQTRATRDERGANGDISVAVTQALAGHETTVAYNQQHREAQALADHGRSWMSARIAQTKVEAGFGAVMAVVQVILTLAMAVVGVWQVRNGSLSVGQLLALTGYLGYLYPRIQNLADLVLDVSAAVVSADRVATLLDLPAADVDEAGAQDFSSSSRSVSVHVRGVTFGYDDHPVLRDLDLDIEAGAITALVGPSGTGKSTLAGLITRFETPQRGSILLGDTDIRTLTASSVRDHVTLLPQHTVIKAASIADNIAYGTHTSTRAEIVAAAIAADAHSFITELPDGYDTRLDEEGLTLSGGQRQRIAIARAMLRDTEVLILDEPTTGLDDATVDRIAEPLRRLATGRATLLITHDTRLAAMADRVVELRPGTRETATV